MGLYFHVSFAYRVLSQYLIELSNLTSLELLRNGFCTISDSAHKLSVTIQKTVAKYLDPCQQGLSSRCCFVPEGLSIGSR